jgi:VCBS repeat-containing protein
MNREPMIAILPVRRRAVVEALEARILFSADFSPALLAPAATADVRTVDATPVAPMNDAASVRHELIVVDANTPDYEKLVKDFMAGSQAQGGESRQFDVVVLDANRDGITQLSEVLARYRGLDAVHLISHGSAGSIDLGSSRLDATTLAADADEIAGWRSAFAAGGDLLVYGCNVAATADGQSMLTALARLTGADVAASTDATGSAARGGDWTLEFHTGAIETTVAPASAFTNWTQTLAATPVGGETLVNTTTAGTQQTAASAMDANGNYVVVWNGQNGSGTSIFAQRYNAAGVAQGSQFQINNNAVNSESQPDVAIDNAGNFVVVWSGQDSNGTGIFAQRYNAAGVAQGSNFQVNTTTAHDQSNPSVAVDANGNFVVVWQSDDRGSLALNADFNIDMQRYNAAGVAQGGEVRVNTYSTNDQTLPDVGMDANGNYTIVWQSEKGLLPLALPPLLSLSDVDIIGQRYDAAGNKFGNEFTIGSTVGSQQAPAISVNASGAFVVAWQGDQSGTIDIYAQRFNTAGTAQGGQIAVNTTIAGDQTRPDVALSDLGDFVVAWQSAGQDGNGAGIYLQQVSAAGVADGGEVRVNTTTAGDQQRPALGMDDAGNFVVVWDGNGSDSITAATDSAGVFTQLFDAPNVPPSLSLPGGALSWIEDTPPAVVNGSAVVNDLDSPDFDTGSLSVSFSANGSADDRLGIQNTGVAAGQIGVSGSNVTYGGVVIGSFVGGIDGSTPLVISFNANASIAAVQALTRSITYQNVSQNPSTLVRTLQFTVNDGDGGSASATTTVNVIAVNDAPVATNDAASGNEDTVISGNVLANDSDVDSPTLSAVLKTGPMHGTLSLNSDGSYSYTPNANYNGSDSFTYVANDGALDSNVATVSLSIIPVNDAPVATNDAASGNEDTVISGNVLANDSDVDSPTLTAVLKSGPAHGALTLNTDGSYSYTPNANYNGSDSFTYVANDGALDSNIATVTLTINPVNDAPVAADDTASGNEDTVISGNVLANDSDVDSPTLTAVLKTGPTHGALSLNSDGSYSYTPNANYNGSDSFTYVANDGALDSNVATVSLTITPVNDPPVAADDSATVNEGAAVAINLAANDSDVDSALDLNSIQIVGVPAHGNVVVNGNGNVTYSHDGGETTADSFTYTISDAQGAVSNVATVTLTITPINDPPLAVNDAASGNEDTVITGNVLANDSDVDSPTLTAVLKTSPTHGTLTLNPNGNFSYTPNANYNGSDSFTYVANDGALDSNVATVSLTITPVNDAPVATNDAASGNEDTVISGNVLANDSDVDSPTLTAVLKTGPTHGTLTLNANGSFSYTPNANYNGSDSFSYVANDGALDSNLATVSLTIIPVNDPPTLASASTFSAPEGAPVAVTIAANDVDGDSVSWAISGGTDAALFSINANSGVLSLKIIPDYEKPVDANHDNIYEVTVRAADGNGGFLTQPIRVIVTDVLEAPTTPGNGGSGTGNTGGGVTTPVAVTPGKPVVLPVFEVTPVRALTTASPVVEIPVSESVPVRTPAAGFLSASLADAVPAALDQRTLVTSVAEDTGNATSARSEPVLQLAGLAAPVEVDLSQQLELNAARASFIGLSLGALWWVVQTGGLLSVMLASMPIWRNLDTLSILDEDDDGVAIDAADADADDTDLFGPGR